MRETRDEAAPLVDPVCGTVVASGSPIRYAIGHEEYVFCSSECRERFANDTASYVPHPGGAFACDHDPDVSSYKPGVCPKCGKALGPVH